MDAYIVAFALVILYLIYFLLNERYSYWKKRNVPYIKPVPMLGNYSKYILLQEYVGVVLQKLCLKLPKEPYFGAFLGTEPVLVVQSPDLLKLILTKDFHYFNGREISRYRHKEVITQNLFFASGNRWNILRHNLNTLFSTAKMKDMFYLIEKCCLKFETMLDLEAGKGAIEAKEFCSRYTMDCIISCCFGIEAETMDKPEDNKFVFIGHEIFNSTNFRGFKLVFRSIWPAIFYGLGFKLFSPVIDSFFLGILKNVFEQRNHAASARNDFVDLLLKFKQEDFKGADKKNGTDGKEEFIVNDNLLASMCVLFFAAGFETSASTLSFTLFELAKHPDAQQRAAEEVDEFLSRHGNKLDYDSITELPYLEACIYETLRKYPVLGNITREVMEDYKLPDGLHVNKGVRIHVPVYSLHHNPEYFPEPTKYKPERFLPENKNTITKYTFFPYGEGPRICLGKRFAKMQVLPGLVTFLKKYRVELAEGMSSTVNLESRSILIQTRDQVLMLKATEREGWEKRVFSQN